MVDVYVNYWAVFVCGLANMAIGFAWFGPVFGRQWVALQGWSKEHMEQGAKKMAKDGWRTYLLAFVGSVITAYILAHFLVFANTYTGTWGASAGLMVGFWAWLGFVVPVMLGTVLWEGKSWKLWLLTSGYYLASLLTMGLILSLWVY